MTSEIVVGVTGANGYLGRSLTTALRARGVKVVEFRRARADGAASGSTRQWDLAGHQDPSDFDDLECLVHAAWDLRETEPARAWTVNVDGSKRLLAAARKASVGRCIFVSSMSAYFGTAQTYGLMKLAVERSFLEVDQIVVRPGLVYGGEVGGMARTLTKLSRLPLIPVFRGAHQFTLHLDDFLDAMHTLITREDVTSSVIGLAHPTPTPFRELMTTLAADSGRSGRFVNVPWHPLLLALRAGERVGLPLPVRSDSLLGLVRPAPSVPGQTLAAELGLHFRAFKEPSPSATP